MKQLLKSCLFVRVPENESKGGNLFEIGFITKYYISIFYFRFIETEEIHQPELIVAVGVLGLLVNVIGLFLFHGNSTSYRASVTVFYYVKSVTRGMVGILNKNGAFHFRYPKHYLPLR